MQKLVSVIMSTFNTNRNYLKKAIESILNQTYKNIQFIIINDGSTKEDENIIKSFKDDRILYINHEKNKGLVYSLNEGIKKAKGDYIARMDSDDIALKDRIQIQVEYMEKHKDIVVTSTFFKMFGKVDKIITNSLISPDEVKCELFYRCQILHPGVMIRKSIIEKYGFEYDEKALYTEDYELWTRIVNIGKIAIIPKLCMYYRMHEEQIGISKKDRQREMTIKILEKNLDKLNMNNNKNIQYLLFLNEGMDKDKIDFKSLLSFINNVDLNNKKSNIYNKKMKNILKNRVILQILKYKLNKKNIFMFFNKDTIKYFIKRFYFNLIII